MNDYYYDNSSGPTVSTFTVEYSKARAGLIIAFMIFPFLPVIFFRDLFQIYMQVARRVYIKIA